MMINLGILYIKHAKAIDITVQIERSPTMPQSNYNNNIIQINNWPSDVAKY